MGAFCGTSQRQQLSQNKKSFSGTPVLPAGLSLGSFNGRSTTNYQKKKKKEGEKTMCERKAVTLICAHGYQKTSAHQEPRNIQQSASSHRKQSSPHRTCVTAVTSRDYYLFLQKENENNTSHRRVYLAERLVIKQLRRKAKRRLGRSTHP